MSSIASLSANSAGSIRAKSQYRSKLSSRENNLMEIRPFPSPAVFSGLDLRAKVKFTLQKEKASSLDGYTDGRKAKEIKRSPRGSLYFLKRLSLNSFVDGGVFS